MTRRLALAIAVLTLSAGAATSQLSSPSAFSLAATRASMTAPSAAPHSGQTARTRAQAARKAKAADDMLSMIKSEAVEAAIAAGSVVAQAAHPGPSASASPAPAPTTAPTSEPPSTPPAKPTDKPSDTPTDKPTDKPTHKPSPTPSPTTSSPAPQTNRVTRQGSQLLLNGNPFVFTGVNAFGAATDYATNAGCGGPVDLTTLFSELAPHGVVRFWAFEGMAWNSSTQAIDFTGIDRVVAAAGASGRKLIMTLSDQAGTCDDGRWHDQSWYDGGYADPNASGSHGMSYLDWVNLIVTRYAGNPAIAFWEPVNEPEASTCTGGATGSACYGASRTCAGSGEVSLRNFFDAIGADIKQLDPTGLVSTGFIGDKQCGVNGGGFDRIAASAYVDLLTYHDYSGDDETLPPDMAGRIAQAAADGKPLAIEEAGIDAGSSCEDVSDRAGQFQAKASAEFAQGIVGYLPWTVQGATDSCGYSLGLDDPVIPILKALGD